MNTFNVVNYHKDKLLHLTQFPAGRTKLARKLSRPKLAHVLAVGGFVSISTGSEILNQTFLWGYFTLEMKKDLLANPRWGIPVEWVAGTEPRTAILPHLLKHVKSRKMAAK